MLPSCIWGQDQPTRGLSWCCCCHCSSGILTPSIPTGFLAALLKRDNLVTALAEANGTAAAEADTLHPPLSTALDIAEEAGLNRKGLQRLLVEGSADATVTLKQHAYLAR
jgi:hypothetical protein